jgi:para-nitrobenzyl esterase
MKTRALLASLLAGIGLMTTNPAQAQKAGPDPAVVRTASGHVRGVIRDGLREFKGIPYAQSPVGDLRWTLPRAAKPWKGVLDAGKYGSACPQVSRYGLTEASDDENCLTLNITAPYDGKPAKRKPVFVWIHGGAFVGGSSALYPLGMLAKAGDIVVVSMNYRLGVFGFMAHPGFDKSYNGGYGLKDQRLALAWVKRNIAAFGGDPNNITIAGESAGGAGVCMHLIAPQETRGLFNKAIMQSAGCATPLHMLQEAQKIGETVAQSVGCADAKTAVACMRKKSVKDLTAAASKAGASDLMAYAPVIGTKTVPLQGAQAFASGKFVRVPVMNGGTRDELRLYLAYDMQAGAKITNDNYADKLKAIYGNNTDAVLKQYPLRDYSSAPAALGTAMSDFHPTVGLNNCIYLEAAKLIRKRVPVYELVFGDRDAPEVTSNPGFEMGAVHSSELPYFFPHFDNTGKVAGPDLKPSSLALAKQMMAYWMSFARTGKPVAKDSPAWPSFKSNADVMRFDPGKVGMFDAAAEHKCAFWKTLYPNILTQ